MKLEFNNENLQMKQIEETKFEYTFFGEKTTYSVSRENIEKSFEDVKRKLLKAYDLVPVGAVIIPRALVGLCKGWLIGGILEDSLYAVYGLCQDRGIGGYSCSIFWLPTDGELSEIVADKTKLHGDFKIKG